MLWSASVAKGYSAPLWVIFKQARELGANVRKCETGGLVVYADRITRAETYAKGEEVEKAIPFLKGYTVFNADQINGLPAHYYARAEAPALTRRSVSNRRNPTERRRQRRPSGGAWPGWQTMASSRTTGIQIQLGPSAGADGPYRPASVVHPEALYHTPVGARPGGATWIVRPKMQDGRYASIDSRLRLVSCEEIIEIHRAGCSGWT